jgi:hypothetical protein
VIIETAAGSCRSVEPTLILFNSLLVTRKDSSFSSLAILKFRESKAAVASAVKDRDQYTDTVVVYLSGPQALASWTPKLTQPKCTQAPNKRLTKHDLTHVRDLDSNMEIIKYCGNDANPCINVMSMAA